MSLISSSIPNFVNGVSQQPFTLRLSSQCEAQENGISTAAQGLKKRPPTQHLNKVPVTSSDVFVHTINRDQTERYVVVIQNGDLNVYDVYGNKQVVNFPHGKGYLGASSPVAAQFAACSVADYTFIVNKGVVVGQSGSVSPPITPMSLVWVKTGNYGKTYSIYLDGALAAQYTTPNGDNASQAPLIGTEYIASRLVSDMGARGVQNWGFSWGQYGSIIHIVRNVDFGIITEDGWSNNAMTAIKDKVGRFSDLPASARVMGYQIEVSSDTSANSDNYWVTYQNSNPNVGSNASGVWKESLGPQTNLGVNPGTMPYVLVREANGTFTFKQGPWMLRKVGTMVTNPDPSFVGGRINDVFFYRNRLGLLSDENVIFSEAGEFFNFFRTSVITLLDSDPIDVASTHTKVSILKHAIQFNKQLLLFSAQSQFVIDESGILTPKTVSIKLASEFPSNDKAKPVATGKNVYFSVNKGQWSAVREYFVDTNNLQNDAADVTGHVPRYIPSGVYKIAASANEDILICASENDRNGLYVYKYYYNNGEKLQASWSRWAFGPGDNVLGMEVMDSYLYLLITRSDGNMYFERIDLATTASLNNEPFIVHLDRKVQISRNSLTWDGTYTTVPTSAIGYIPVAASETYQAVTLNGGSAKAGSIFPTVIDANGNLKIKADLRGTDIVIGKQYAFRYVLSPITVKQQQGQGQKSDTEGRLQLRKISFNYADTGYFQVNVTPTGRQTFQYKFAGKILGISAVLGQVTLPTGKFAVPVMAQNVGVKIEIVNDTPLPCAFLSADWEGFYVKRSQAV